MSLVLGTIFLLVVTGVAGVWYLSRIRGRVAVLRQSDPETPLAYRNYQAAAMDDSSVPRWAECPVYECPTLSLISAPEERACEICDLELNGTTTEPDISRARQHFAQCGTVLAPDQVKAWGERMPTAEEIEIKRTIVAECAQARTAPCRSTSGGMT